MPRDSKTGSPREEALPRRLDVKHANIQKEIDIQVSNRSSNKKKGAEKSDAASRNIQNREIQMVVAKKYIYGDTGTRGRSDGQQKNRKEKAS